MKNKIILSVFITLAAGIFILSCVPQAYAYRSRAGGADIQEFDVGNFIEGAGKQMLSSAVSGAINGSKDIGGSMLGGYNSWVANQQMGRAVQLMGAYNEWDPKKSFMMQNIIGGAAGGFVGSGGSGIATGAIDGAISGAVTWSIDGDRIKDGHNASFGGRLAGQLVGNLFTDGADSIGSTIVNSVVSRVIIGDKDPYRAPEVDRYVNNANNGVLQPDNVGDLTPWIPSGGSISGAGTRSGTGSSGSAPKN